VNKFKVERKTIAAAQLRRVRNRVQESIAKMDPDAWQRFVARLGDEEITETFIFGADGDE
jgi:division protein CdvB (Snf7/Vps24/ESCRT-III family)